MDFIERMFGAAPDGGDGSLELVWLLAAAVAVVAIVFRGRIRTWLGARSSARD